MPRRVSSEGSRSPESLDARVHLEEDAPDLHLRERRVPVLSDEVGDAALELGPVEALPLLADFGDSLGRAVALPLADVEEKLQQVLLERRGDPARPCRGRAARSVRRR